ncbi:unnamed protein product, partial [Ectocarpus fasciculatus]
LRSRVAEEPGPRRHAFDSSSSSGGGGLRREVRGTQHESVLAKWQVAAAASAALRSRVVEEPDPRRHAFDSSSSSGGGGPRPQDRDARQESVLAKWQVAAAASAALRTRVVEEPGPRRLAFDEESLIDGERGSG